MSDGTKFQTLAILTMSLSKDIYSDSIEKASNDSNFSVFTDNSYYRQEGRISATFGANSSTYMPKIMVWDWKGNKTAKLSRARIIVIRGTQSLEEWKGNFDCDEVNGKDLGVEIDGYFHKNFLEIAKKIWDLLGNYIIYSPYPVIITGHSRGAGIAEVLHVIAKRKLQNQPFINLYCMAHAPPPSMSLNETDSLDLAKDIYGFVNGNDVVPRMFVSKVIELIDNDIKFGNGNLLSICNLFFSIDQCSIATTLKISILTKYLTKVLPKFQKSIIINATLQMKPKLLQLLNKFKYNPENVIINKQTGNVFHLDWKELSDDNGCVTKPLMDSRLDDPKNLTPINIGIKLWKYKDLINHHDPKYYQHAFIDPICN